MRVLNFGSLNIDRVYTVDRLVTPGHAKLVKEFQVMAGGKGLNQSIAVRKAGTDSVYHAGNIGKNGDLLKFTLLEHKVNIDFIEKSNVDAGHAVIQLSEDANHTILVHAGSNYCNSKAMIERTIAHFEKGDILLLQNEINDIDYIIDLAHARGMRIFLNPAPFDEKVFKYDLNKVDTLIVNASELFALTEADSIETAIKRLKKFEVNVLLTLKLSGGIYFDTAGNQVRYPAYQAETIDSTAAGDVFIGYFLAGIIQNKTIKVSLNQASKAAAVSTTKVGASDSIPSPEAIQAYFDERGLYEYKQ